MPIARHFLTPERDLPSQAAGYLARDWEEGNLDLGAVLVVVSSRQAGRRLREALAVRAAASRAAVFPPVVVTPEFLVTYGFPRGGVASGAESLLAWAATLQEIDPGMFRAVFPTLPDRRDFPWALGTARELMRVKRLLAEGGWRMADIASREAGDLPEGDRWRDLGALEERYCRKLSEAKVRDPDEARIACAENPVLPEQVEKVVLMAVPDPLPLALRAVERLSESLPVEVVIAGDSEPADLFDEWGRPRPDAWESREVPVEDEDRFHLGAGPGDQAKRAGALLAACGQPVKMAAVGAADAEVIPFLEHALPRDCGIDGYNPEGRPLRSQELYVVLGTLRDLLRSPSFAIAGELLRSPLFFRSLQADGSYPPLAQLLRAWDAFYQRCLPGDLDEGLRLARKAGKDAAVVRKVIERIRELLGELARGPVWKVLPEMMRALHGRRGFDESDDSDRRYTAAAGELMTLVDGLRRSPVAATIPRGADGLDLILALLGDQRVEEERPDAAVDLLGWLELAWEDAPYLVLTGMNERSVPETLTGDPFLPESLRRRLGLRDNRDRTARDQYLLEYLVRSRRESGRVEIVFGKTSEAGDPLRPSSLLLRCAREKLPERVDRLFAAPPASRARAPWTSPWKLAPRRVEVPETIGVTRFGRYLQCPFRFYLSDLLRMEPIDTRKTEMDGGEFGELCHAVLEAFGRDERLKRSADAGEIGAFFEERLDELVADRYGKTLSVPLMIQKESAAQRLAYAARVQAEERAKGWLIEDVEWTFGEGGELEIGGFSVRGKIDRIERNEDTGAYRILDYKTSDKNRHPREDHWTGLKKNDDPDELPGYARLSLDGKDGRWTGLQLPLYRRAVRDRCGDGVECGYFTLPKAVSETGVRVWEGMSPDLDGAALQCAEGVAADLRRGRFWPPARAVGYDPFEGLFFGIVEDLVDPAALAGGAGKEEEAP